MTEESGYVSVGNGKLHYLKWGSGKKLLLAFHGYGDSAALFSPVQEFLDSDYTILSFDLPHHGNSVWPPHTKLLRKDIAELVGGMMADYQVDKVSLIGFSIGGRVCLAIATYMPRFINRITLVAADGMRIDPYYYFFTRTFFGKKMFRHMLQHPQPYFRVMDWMKRMRLVPESRYKFAMHFIHSEASRSLLLQVWPTMSALMPAPDKIKAVIKKHCLPVTIFMGAYDKIMPPTIAVKFMKGLDTVQLHILQKGHRVLDHETARQIASSLL